MQRDWPDDFANIAELRKRSRQSWLLAHLFALQELLNLSSEFVALLFDPVFWNHGHGGGDRGTILVLPGYSSTDLHTLPLRNWLRAEWISASDIGNSENAGVVRRNT
jgi:hypothetical protein